ncbi:Spindle pole body component [Cercospora zeina]
MAHAATLDRLAGGLVTAITGQSKNHARYQRSKSLAVKGLRDKTHARTNQFAISAKYDGLVEKLAVLNREDVADALQTRLEQLPAGSQWIPEALSLFVELSDRPASQTILSHVTVDGGDPGNSARMTWEEIIAEDPLDEPGVWEDVDHGYHSSADEQTDLEDASDHTVSTTATSVDEDTSSAARTYLIEPDESAISAVREAQQTLQSQKNGRSHMVSELTLVREILLMLHGLPTELFPIDRATGRVTVSRKLILATASSTTLTHIVTTTVKSASALNYLRAWVKSSQSLLYVRAVQSAIQRLLASFTSRLAALEQRYINPPADIVVSINDTATQAQDAATALIQLSTIVQVAALSTGGGQQLVLLDTLYNEACLSQLSGATARFDALVTVFLAGLCAYSKPIAAWMTSGEAVATYHDVPLVVASNEDCDASQIWDEQFIMNTTAYRSTFVPKCLLAYADRIFALGKSRAFLNRLQPGLNNSANSAADLPFLGHHLITDSLVSFSQLLDDELSAWIDQVGNDCTPSLLKSLRADHGLSSTISAVPMIFFSGNGIAFRDFADAVVKRMVVKGDSKAWNDRFMLAELARSTIGTCENVDSNCIQVDTPSGEVGTISTSTTRLLNSFNLEYIFAWPVQNITGCKTSSTHAKVFSFLLQVHYARDLMTRTFFNLRSEHQRSTLDLALRQRLLWFTDTLHFFIATTASTIHRDTAQSMDAASDIDAMVSIWQHYQGRLQMSLLLSPKLEPVRDAVTGMLELSETLARTTRLGSIAALQDQFDRSLKFLVAGLRGLSRAGGDVALEALAERLEWTPP